mmetsp:Transcript_23348/g.51091  ORF Transcript_23348/g.51091 Transcript_23348/m.51091 type:complete len:240 (+) Transcript_23348:965-1684(+)
MEENTQGPQGTGAREGWRHYQPRFRRREHVVAHSLGGRNCQPSGHEGRGRHCFPEQDETSQVGPQSRLRIPTAVQKRRGRWRWQPKRGRRATAPHGHGRQEHSSGRRSGRAHADASGRRGRHGPQPDAQGGPSDALAVRSDHGRQDPHHPGVRRRHGGQPGQGLAIGQGLSPEAPGSGRGRQSRGIPPDDCLEGKMASNWSNSSGCHACRCAIQRNTTQHNTTQPTYLPTYLLYYKTRL